MQETLGDCRKEMGSKLIFIQLAELGLVWVERAAATYLAYQMKNREDVKKMSGEVKKLLDDAERKADAEKKKQEEVVVDEDKGSMLKHIVDDLDRVEKRQVIRETQLNETGTHHYIKLCGKHVGEVDMLVKVYFKVAQQTGMVKVTVTVRSMEDLGSVINWMGWLRLVRILH
ncbi:hypothetical protein POM88_024304 [Heracleum sosnowskyi]|uniref:Uncharacterized protein n=1 Tax=Heracleum sosnowskyi TaxID=360622 RepID=A0AAD8I4U2_9APIA|nr:hypothetical protein POM88_024304 [Heracleum sosnowskyi]